MLKIRYPAAVAALLVNAGVLVALASLANHPYKPPIERTMEVALITPPAPATPEPPKPEPQRKPEPLPVTTKPPPKVPPKVQPKPTPTPTPTPAPVALAPAATETSTNTIAAEPAPAAAPVIAKAAEPIPEPIKEPPKVDASWSGNTLPVYPALARRMHIEGRTVLDVHVAADGTVINVRLKKSSGSSLLDEAAIETIKKWRFTPATLGGKPVAEWYYNWPTVFSLNE